jgi:glutathione S-transferase
MAINLYLVDKHGGPRWPHAPRERALVYQWSLWSQTEMDRPDWQQAWRSGDAKRMEAAKVQRLVTLGRLNAALSGRDYLLGDAFTFADLNLAATICQPNEGGRIDGNFDPIEHGLPALGAWLKRCTARASWLKVRDLP